MKELFNITVWRYACLIILCVGWLSCDDNINDWDVDESTKGLFRPLTFEKVENDATTITLRYSKIVNANKYILCRPIQLFENCSIFNTHRCTTVGKYCQRIS